LPGVAEGEAWTPFTLWGNAWSIGNNPFILPELTTTNREMIQMFINSTLEIFSDYI
jgi:hypothetical protein